MRFDPGKILLDPYGRGVVVPGNYSREAARLKGDNVATAMKNVVVDTTGYDWAGDTRLHRPASRTIIYEMHIRGFTRILTPEFRSQIANRSTMRQMAKITVMGPHQQSRGAPI